MRQADDPARDRLAVALDVPRLDQAVSLMKRLEGWVGWFKIGAELFTEAGPRALEEARQRGRVFLDTKLHDIPNSVAGAVRAAAHHGVDLMTLHASGGGAMLQAARAAAEEAKHGSAATRPKLVAVTVLTSVAESALKEVGLRGPLTAQVERLVELALRNGLDGVVASPREAALVRKRAGQRLMIVTPGVRLRPDLADDQRRTANCEEAIRAGADLIVVGRPILKAPDPVEAAGALLGAIRCSLDPASA